MNDPLEYSVPLPKWIRGKKLTELTGATFELEAESGTLVVRPGGVK